jgi:hypothetical protein
MLRTSVCDKLPELHPANILQSIPVHRDRQPGLWISGGNRRWGYTWSVNSRENQLTPWSNDPVTDRSGETFYLRDNDSGDHWSATALPIRDETVTYVARHGRGSWSLHAPRLRPVTAIPP